MLILTPNDGAQRRGQASAAPLACVRWSGMLEGMLAAALLYFAPEIPCSLRRAVVPRP